MEIIITTSDPDNYDKIVKSLATNKKIILNGMKCEMTSASFAPPFAVSLSLFIDKKLELEN